MAWVLGNWPWDTKFYTDPKLSNKIGNEGNIYEHLHMLCIGENTVAMNFWICIWCSILMGDMKERTITMQPCSPEPKTVLLGERQVEGTRYKSSMWCSCVRPVRAEESISQDEFFPAVPMTLTEHKREHWLSCSTWNTRGRTNRAIRYGVLWMSEGNMGYECRLE